MSNVWKPEELDIINVCDSPAGWFRSLTNYLTTVGTY